MEDEMFRKSAVIYFFFLYVVEILCILFAIYYLGLIVFSKYTRIFHQEYYEADINGIIFNVGQWMVPKSDVKYLKFASIYRKIYSLGMQIFLFFICHNIRKILQPMKQQQPFIKGISNRIRTIAWIYFVYGLFLNIFSNLIRIYNLKGMTKVWYMDKIIIYKVSILPDFIFVTLILLFVSYIFRYGEMLQQESDETL